MLLYKRIREAIKTIISSNIDLNVTIEEMFKIAGIGNIKTFAQIGSNDGLKNDPINKFIKKHNWTGILVEPDISNFNKLINNYKEGENFFFYNLGIGPFSGVMRFYKLAEIQDFEPDWYDQVGSFDKETFIKNIEVIPGLINRMIAETVRIITFDELMQNKT